MVQVGSKLRVSDNTGAKYVSCIKVLGGYKKRYAHIGDKLVVSVVSLRAKRRSQAKIQKGKVTYGIVVRTKIDKSSSANIKYSFIDNAIVLITQQGKPLASRVIGGVPKKIRYTRYMRIATLSAGIIK
jgi:large subunit ribosomal protein L14